MKRALIFLTLAAGLGSGPVWAQDANAAIKARQGQFRVMALNLGILGAIAKGEMEYDSAVAQAAADNLVAVSSLDQQFNWPANSGQMDAANTRALPAIWDNLDDFGTKWQAFGTSVQAMQGAAGQDVDAIRAAMGPIGNSCKSCHESYRAEN